MSVSEMIMLRLSTFNKRRYNMALLFFIPLIIIAGIFFINSPQSNNRPLSIAVLDEDMTDLSRQVIERLYNNELLRVTQYDNQEKPRNALLRYDINAFFVIGSGFSNSVTRGYIDDSVLLYYVPGDVTVQISAELFTKELMRVYISVLGVEYIKQVYRDYGSDFPPDTEDEAYAYIDSFWEGELTIPIIHKYAEESQTPRYSLKAAIAKCIMYSVLLFLLLCLSVDLTLQRERGVIKRLELYHISAVKYLFTTALTDILPYIILVPIIAAAVSIVPHLAFGLYDWMIICFLFPLSAVINAVLNCFINRLSDLLTAAVVLSLLGGVLMFFV